MDSLGRRVAAVQGWRALAAAFALGALAVLALPPIHLVPVLLISLTGAFWLLSGAGCLRAALARGFAFGLGYFALGLYWIGFAFLVYPDRFGWMAPFGVLGLAAILAVFPALQFAVFHILARGRKDAGAVILFAGLWVLFEWARGVVLTGFPWNPLGVVWTFSDAMIQAASLGGVYGLSLLTVLAATAPAALRPDGRGRLLCLGVAALLVFQFAGGAVRLGGASDATVPGVHLRLVQPNIDQKLKWRPELRERHVVAQIRLSVAPPEDGGPRPTHVIWAETATPFYLARDPARLALVARGVPAGGLLITGAPRLEQRINPAPGEDPVRVWNSLHAVDDTGTIVATYDKAHLVPFGEYTPFRDVLARIMDVTKITAGSVDFSPGPGPQTISLPGLPPVSPLICYEVIFPGAVSAGAAAARPGWLLNLTNDGWYGKTAGPHQHFALARLRAVEEGLPLVRVANTGISAVVDGYGRVTGRLALGTEGVLDRPLPRALPVTMFARVGNIFALFVAILCVGMGLWMGRKVGRVGVRC